MASSIPSREDVSHFIHSLNRVKQTNRELHSQRCDFLIKLQVAKEMRNEERIYFPHNIDFRGRAYTMHVHLNHLGSDICRGALLFADARPLGDKGLDWLCVQAANLYGGGVDKLPMDERRDWIKDRFDIIRAAARDPLGPAATFGSTRRIRGSAGVCLEIDGRSRRGPATYSAASRAPGRLVQRSAALRCARSRRGGRRAGEPHAARRPGDVYTASPTCSRRSSPRTCQGGRPGDGETRRSPRPHIDRKLVKQTVMTSVYGVTHMARGSRFRIGSRNAAPWMTKI